MELEQAHRPAAHAHRFEQAVSILQPAVAIIDATRALPVDPDTHGDATRARSMPFALARVSASSCAGIESATMPAPALKQRVCACAEIVRIKMLKSQLPSRLM